MLHHLPITLLLAQSATRTKVEPQNIFLRQWHTQCFDCRLQCSRDQTRHRSLVGEFCHCRAYEEQRVPPSVGEFIFLAYKATAGSGLSGRGRRKTKRIRDKMEPAHQSISYQDLRGSLPKYRTTGYHSRKHNRLFELGLPVWHR